MTQTWIIAVLTCSTTLHSCMWTVPADPHVFDSEHACALYIATKLPLNASTAEPSWYKCRRGDNRRME